MAAAKDKKYRVGVIGCGRKGTGHALGAAHNPMTQVVAGADTDPENLEIFCRRFKVPGYGDYREMLDKEDIDIALPILPVKPNPEVVIGCAEAGVKAICCEKPIAAVLADADRMVEACRSRGIKLASGDLYRNFFQLWDAKRIIDSGEIGEVQSISMIGGSGPEWDIQGLSVTRMFADDAEVAWVIGWVTGDPFSDHDQGQAGYIRFVNGIEAFRHRNDTDKKGLEVLCSRGVFYTDWYSFHLWKADPGAERPRWASLKEVEGLFPDSGIGERTYDANGLRLPGNRQIATTQSVVDALEENIEPRGSGDNGRKCLEIAIALRESHRRGHTPVRLPLEDRSLKIIPPMSRWLNKKPQMGAEAYAESIGGYERAQ